MGLVERYGERVDGPCPALMPSGEGFGCGLLLRPKDFLPAHPRGVTQLRAAFTILVGVGMGCDEAGDEPDHIAGPKLQDIQNRFIDRYGRNKINEAARIALIAKPS